MHFRPNHNDLLKQEKLKIHILVKSEESLLLPLMKEYVPQSYT